MKVNKGQMFSDFDIDWLEPDAVIEVSDEDYVCTECSGTLGKDTHVLKLEYDPDAIVAGVLTLEFCCMACACKWSRKNVRPGVGSSLCKKKHAQT